MGQKVKIRWFWRKKKDGTRSMPTEQESIWIDIAKRTAKTFLQVALGVLAASFAPDKWKAAVTTAVSAGVCAAMNYFIKRVQDLVGDPDAPDQQKEDDDVYPER